MKNLNTYDFFKKNAPHFLYIFIGFWVLFCANYHGLGITFDSQNYIHASKTYQEKGIFLNKDKSLYTQQPPLFPYILHFFLPKNDKNDNKNDKILEKKSEKILAKNIFIFHQICFVITLFIWLLFAQRWFGFSVFYHLFALSLVTATPLILVHHFVWSEPLFLMLLSLDLFFFEQKKSSIITLPLGVGGLFCSFLYCLQRNTGIFFVFGKMLILFFNPFLSKIKSINKKIKIGKEAYNPCLFGGWRFFLLSVWGLGCVFGWAIWTFYALQNTPNAGNTAGFLSHFSWNLDIISIFLVNGKNLFLVFCTYFFPLFLIEKYFFLGIFIKMFAVILFFAMPFFAQKAKNLLIISGVYIGFLLLFVPDFSDAERYLAVIYPVFLLVFYEFLAIFHKKLSQKNHIFKGFFKIFLLHFLFYFLIIFLLYFQAYNLARCYKNIIFFQEYKSDMRFIQTPKT